jgi:hypothetical protein
MNLEHVDDEVYLADVELLMRQVAMHPKLGPGNVGPTGDQPDTFSGTENSTDVGAWIR